MDLTHIRDPAVREWAVAFFQAYVPSPDLPAPFTAYDANEGLEMTWHNVIVLHVDEDGYFWCDGCEVTDYETLSVNTAQRAAQQVRARFLAATRRE